MSCKCNCPKYLFSTWDNILISKEVPYRPAFVHFIASAWGPFRRRGAISVSSHFTSDVLIVLSASGVLFWFAILLGVSLSLQSCLVNEEAFSSTLTSLTTRPSTSSTRLSTSGRSGSNPIALSSMWVSEMSLVMHDGPSIACLPIPSLNSFLWSRWNTWKYTLLCTCVLKSNSHRLGQKKYGIYTNHGGRICFDPIPRKKQSLN